MRCEEEEGETEGKEGEEEEESKECRSSGSVFGSSSLGEGVGDHVEEGYWVVRGHDLST